MQTNDTIDEFNSCRHHARSTTFKFTLKHLWTIRSGWMPHHATTGRTGAGGDADSARSALKTFTKFLCPRQRKSQVILFPPPLGEGQPRPQESACAETSASPSPSAPLPLPWPCRRTARAHEWCSRALKIFPPSAFPQELQPKAACCHLSVAGINYLRRAGSGTFLPSLALQDVDIRQVGPASPGWQHGGDKGGERNMTHTLSRDRQKTQKNGKRSGKEHVGAALRCLGAYRVPNARLDADGSLELRWNKDICVCVDLLR